MTGDLNARCGTLTDFVNFEDSISEVNFDFETNSLLNRNNLLELGFPLERYSNDRLCNNFGYRLLDLCKTLDIHIVNGRCGSDAFIGQNTCVKGSLIDFVVASPELFPMFSSFHILDFDPLLSDVHKAVKFSILCKREITNSEAEEPTESPEVTKTIWNRDLRPEFRNSFDQEEPLCKWYFTRVRKLSGVPERRSYFKYRLYY